MSGLRIPVGLRNSHPSTCLQRTLCFLCPDGRFLFPWLTAGFQGIHDFVSPSPPTGGGVCVQVGAMAPLPTPGFQSFSLPLCLRCLLAAHVFGASRGPAALGCSSWPGLFFPAGQVAAVPSKPKQMSAGQQVPPSGDDCLPTQVLVTCLCLY